MFGRKDGFERNNGRDLINNLARIMQHKLVMRLPLEGGECQKKSTKRNRMEWHVERKGVSK